MENLTLVESRTHWRSVVIDGGGGDREVYGDSSVWATIAEMGGVRRFSETRRCSNRTRSRLGFTGLDGLPRLP